MTKFFRIIDPLYILLLGIGIGGIIACGAFAAPVVFRIGDMIPGLGPYEGGMIMGGIFVRLNMYLLILLLAIIIYELLSFIYLRKTIYSILLLLVGIISSVCIALFVWYYTPFILNPENLVSENFSSMHEQSVLCFKILMVCLAILLVSRSYKKDM
ncbi:DUF4149 domain-containing protein [Helicobacter didelphidarum]|uniref:DUF4149 domain-containing protein n=1 Tax=Helicobacter didelphidarum TaxID=2040648 RepID=A0A3D8IKV7_9HELI|nr:DUF4149 domain-containing protein [Helicobacter didelphidarum]RDU65977.1 DUF4149 domain-containing protein [Helicobacter didelphidarum]